MIKIYKTFFICLALLPSLAFAEESRLIEILETDPGAGETLHAGEPLYVHVRYQSDEPLRFQVQGFAQSSKMDQSVSYNPAPSYPAAMFGEAIAWISYSEKTDIDQLKLVVYDADWDIIHTMPLVLEMHWSGRLAKNWRQPAEWAQKLNAQQQEMAGDSLEQPPQDKSSPLLRVLLLLVVVFVFILIIWSMKRTSK